MNNLNHNLTTNNRMLKRNPPLNQNQYVLGVDLGTSAVKVSALDKSGKIVAQQSFSYATQHPQTGWREQDPETWVSGATVAIVQLILKNHLAPAKIAGLSFSGQMHGLVLLDQYNQVLRPAILWNDTRSATQKQYLEKNLGAEFLKITKNKPIEGLTITKMLWVKENEPDIWQKTAHFLLPKDYLRLRMTNQLATDYSDATGTGLLDFKTQTWSKRLQKELALPSTIFPPIKQALAKVGPISADYAIYSGLNPKTQVFMGGADDAAGALGTGLLDPNQALSIIGTSGIILKYEPNAHTNYAGQLQFEDHIVPNTYYSMGVTLAAGDALNWFQKNFAPKVPFAKLVQAAKNAPLGAKGLLFTPYINGERAPYTDANIRGSFLGLDQSQDLADLTRAVLEGILFNMKDVLNIYQTHDQKINSLIAIGGGAKSPFWLQMQADIFNKKIITLANEQGPGLGAAMVAAVGLNWYKDLKSATRQFTKFAKAYYPNPLNVQKYQKLFEIYHQVYHQTQPLTKQLLNYQRQALS